MVETNKVILSLRQRFNFLLTQLSTYIKSGITLIESLRILTRQYKNVLINKLLKMSFMNLQWVLTLVKR